MVLPNRDRFKTTSKPVHLPLLIRRLRPLSVGSLVLLLQHQVSIVMPFRLGLPANGKGLVAISSSIFCYPRKFRELYLVLVDSNQWESKEGIRSIWPSRPHSYLEINRVAYSISSVADVARYRALSFSRETGFVRWLPVAFLTNGFFTVTCVGFELASPALWANTLNHYTTAPQSWDKDL